KDLFVDYLDDQIPIRKLRKINDQKRGLRDLRNVKFFGLRNLSIRGDPDHLSAVDNDKILRVTVRPKPAGAFQDHEFPVIRLKNGRASADRSRNRGSSYGDFRSLGRHLDKNGSVDQFEIASASLKTEDGICSESCDGEVGKGQLAPRFGARANRRSVFYLVVQ